LPLYFNTFTHTTQEILKIWQIFGFFGLILKFYRAKMPFCTKNCQQAFFDLKKCEICFKILSLLLSNETDDF